MWPKGKPRSPESKAKTSATLRRGYADGIIKPAVKSTETLAKQAQALRASERAKSHRQRLADSRRGKPRGWEATEETRAKLRAAWVIRKQEGRYKGRPRRIRASVAPEPIVLDLPQFDGCVPTHVAEVYGVSSVYAIINTVTNKLYVGSSNDTGARWADHRHELSRGIHHAPILQNAWNKYGPDVFVFRLLERVPPDRGVLLAAEQRWIDHYHAADRQYGYNARPLAHCPLVTGEHNSHAKLTEAQVLVIRQRFDRGDSRAAMAREYGVTRETIFAIGKRQTWKHLDLTL